MKLLVNVKRRVAAARGPHFKIAGWMAALSVLCNAAILAGAQSYSMGWHKIAGGGGISAGGKFQLTGTIGQPDAAMAMNGGSDSLTGGFWSLISVMQTTGAPPLCICCAGQTVTVYWQNVPGYTLQQNSQLGAPSGWTSCPCSPISSNGTNYVNIAGVNGSLFFRLRK